MSELDTIEDDQVNLLDTLDMDVDGTLDIEELITRISMIRGDSHRADIVSVGLTLRAFLKFFQAFESGEMEEREGQRSAFNTIVVSARWTASVSCFGSHHHHHHI